MDYASLSFTEGSSQQFRPVPKPRLSKTGPLITRRIDVSQKKKEKDEQVSQIGHTSHELRNLLTSDAGMKGRHIQKKIDLVDNTSHSDETFNESLALLKQSSSYSTVSSQQKHFTKDVHSKVHQKTGKQSKQLDKFSKHGLIVTSEENLEKPKPAPRSKQPIKTKSVSLGGDKKAVKQSGQFEEFVSQQGIQLYESLGSDISSQADDRAKITSKVSYDKDGKRNVAYSNEFEEYTLSTLQSLSHTESDKSENKQKSKVKQVSLSAVGQKHVRYAPELEDFSSQILQDLQLPTDSEASEKAKRVTSEVSFSSGKRSVRYSSDFESFSQSLDLRGSRHFHSESDLDTLTKSRDKEVTSWVEFKEGKKLVRHSDEFENFSFGKAIEFTSSKQKKDSEVYKKIEYKDGKKHISYSDEFLNSLQSEYSDDFESGGTSSWAVKIKRTSEQSPVTKHVEYKQGKKHVTYSTDLENTLERTAEEVETATSFKEVALEDLEEQSYTEDFDSVTTPRGQSTSRSLANILTIEDLSSSTQTPQTSIQTSLHHSGDLHSRENIHREHGLYSESFETVTSLARSESADVTADDTSRAVSPRHRHRKDTLSRTGSLIEYFDSDDDSYTMTFSQPTVESVEESPEMKRLAQEAKEAFLKSKMKVVKKPKKPRFIPPPQEENLVGEEAKQYNKFMKSKLKFLRQQAESTQESSSKSVPGKSQNISAEKQLKGISTTEPVENCGISASVINRLKMENTMHNLKAAATAEVHDPYTCEHCSEQMSQYAAEQFMWHKKAIVSEKLVQEKMEMQMLQLQDPMWLFAEALRGLPKATDHREDVYDKLMKPLYESYANKANKESVQPS